MQTTRHTQNGKKLIELHFDRDRENVIKTFLITTKEITDRLMSHSGTATSP